MKRRPEMKHQCWSKSKCEERLTVNVASVRQPFEILQDRGPRAKCHSLDGENGEDASNVALASSVDPL